MKPIIITASTPMELSLLLEGTSARELAGIGRVKAFEGELGGKRVVLALTGIGKVNAASAFTALLERFTPELTVNTGCGGAFAGSGLDVGDIAIAESETFADEGVLTPEGWRGLELIGIPVWERQGERIFNTIPLRPEPAADALRCAKLHGFRAKVGPFLTVSTCSGTSLQGEEILLRYPGVCENMEGAALAQVALMYDVPLLEVRGISNLVEDRDLSRWDLKLALSRVQEFLLRYLQLQP